MKIVLVACAGLKQKQSAPAQELYTSPLFKASRIYAERVGDRWFILSAKHGLVAPGQTLDPYNLTLAEMKLKDREAWALRVLHQLLEAGVRHDHLVTFLAGLHYRKYLEKLLHAAGCYISVPMRGKGIGQQISWLQRQNEGAS